MTSDLALQILSDTRAAGDMLLHVRLTAAHDSFERNSASASLFLSATKIHAREFGARRGQLVGPAELLIAAGELAAHFAELMAAEDQR
jgi:hypothetical protein